MSFHRLVRRIIQRRRFHPQTVCFATAIAISVQIVDTSDAYAAPELGSTVVGGKVTDRGEITKIRQDDSRMFIEWLSFNLHNGEEVHFEQQPHHIALNRIRGSSASEINGLISGDGHLIFVNPRGIVFGKDANINVGSLIASGLEIDSDRFLAGDKGLVADRLSLWLSQISGDIVNKGNITSAASGSVTLIGRSVDNSGSILTAGGNVTLAAADTATLFFDDSRLLGIEITKSRIPGLLSSKLTVENSGNIKAAGGTIIMTANKGPDLFATAVNNGNLSLDTTSVLFNEDGSFTLNPGSDVRNSGLLDVSADSGAGQVIVVGQNIENTGNILANSLADNGGRIDLHAIDRLETKGQLDASSSALDGGQIALSGNHVIVYHEPEIALEGDGAAPTLTITASGVNAGGSVDIRGDSRRSNNGNGNAGKVSVDANVMIHANGSTGGNIEISSDTNIEFQGFLMAASKPRDIEPVEDPDPLDDPGLIEGSESVLNAEAGNELEEGGDSEGTAITEATGSTGSASVIAGEALSFTGDAEVGGLLLLGAKEFSVGGPSPGQPGSSEAPVVSISWDKLVELLKKQNVKLQADESLQILSSVQVTENAHDLTLHSGGNVDLQSDIQLSGGNISIIAGDAGCRLVAGCGLDGQRGIFLDSGADLSASGSILLNAADDVLLEGTVGRRVNSQQVQIRAGNAITLNSLEVTSPSTESPSITLSAGDTNLFAEGQGITVQSTAATPATLTILGSLNSGGGDIDLRARAASESANGEITVAGAIVTGGGDLTVGASEDRAGSFTAQGLIDTSSAERGGNITIYSDGDVQLNSASFGGSNMLDQADVGTLLANSQSGKITLSGDYEYNSVKDGALGKIDLTAVDGKIVLNEFTADDGPDGSSQLDIELVAKRGIEVTIGSNDKPQPHVWLNGGSFLAESGKEIKIGGQHLNTEGGSVTLTAPTIELASASINTSDHNKVRSGGAITFNGALVLAANGIITSGNDANERGSVLFNGAVSGGDNEASDLLVTSGQLDFDSITGIKNLVINATGDVNGPGNIINGAVIEASTVSVEALSFYADTIKTTGGEVNIDVANGTLHTGDITTTDPSGAGGGNINLTGRKVTVGNVISDAGRQEGAGSTISTAGEITIIAAAGESDPASVYLGGDISAESSDGTQVQASITLAGDCGDCQNQVTFGGESFISGDLIVTGSGGSDRIEVSAASSEWQVNGDEDHEIRSHNVAPGMHGKISFRGFHELVGSQGDDTFTINALPSEALRIQGSAEPSRSGSDLLQGPSWPEGDYIWEIREAGEGSLHATDGSSGTLEFEGISRLVGGQGNHNLKVLSEESEQLRWTIEDRNTGSVLRGDSLLVKFSDIGALTGGDGDDTFIFDPDGSIVSIDGGEGGSATIRGKNGNNTWSIGSEGGSIKATDNETNYLDSFINVNRLWGGTASDIFEINAEFAGDIAGGRGADTFNINAAVYGKVSGGIGNDEFYLGVVGSANFIEGGSGDDRLSVQSSDSEQVRWTINGRNRGNVLRGDGSPLEFEGIANLGGGDGKDIFRFEDDGRLKSIDGGSGAAVLHSRSSGDAWSLGATSGSLADGDDNYLETFKNITELQGKGEDSLTAVSESTDEVTWNITDSNEGKIAVAGGASLQFFNISHLFGGKGTDTFVFDPDGSVASIDGGKEGSASIYGKHGNNTWSIDSEGGSIKSTDGAGYYLVKFVNVDRLEGGSESDIFNIDAAFAGHIAGGDGDDEFYLGAEGSADSIDGGSGDDRVTVQSRDSEQVRWTINGPNRGNVLRDQSSRIEFDNIASLTGGYGDDTFRFDPDGSIGSIDGGSGTAILYSRSSGDAWSLGRTSGNLADDDHVYLETFKNITELQGQGEDSLTAVSESTDEVIWSITDLNGGHIAHSRGAPIKFANIGNLFGGEGEDIFVFGLGGSIAFIDGGKEGSATIRGKDGNNSWSIDSEGGSIKSTDGAGYDLGTFINVDRLEGGSESDIFNINAAFTGHIAGGAGADTFNINAAVSGDLSGGSGNDTFYIDAAVSGHVAGGDGDDEFYLGIEGSATAIEGGSGDNRLTVQSSDLEQVRWIINGRNRGNVLRDQGSPVEYGNIAHLIGSAGEDTFIFDGDEGSIRTIDGGSGSATIHGKNINNNWTITDGAALGITGEITGYLGRFLNINHLQGGSGNDDFNITSHLSGWAVESIDGGDGENTLTGAPVASTWQITNSEAGSVHHTVDNSAYVNRFINIKNIIGGGEGDTLIDASELDSWNIREWIISEAGRGTLTAVSADRESSAQLIEFGGISSIQGNAAKDELHGPDADITWIINGPDSGHMEFTGDAQTRLAFEGIENLIGGSETDIFKVQEGGSLSGSIDGGIGSDVLEGQNKNNKWTITGQGKGQLQESGSAVAYVKTFFNIEKLVGNESEDTFIFGSDEGSIQAIDGGSGSATIYGRDGNNTWSIDSEGGSIKSTDRAGYYLGKFVNVDRLEGGSESDIFNINAAFTGHIAGGGGADTFNINAAVSGDLSGGSANDTFYIDAAVSGHVAGGDGDDEFYLGIEGSAAAIEGGSGDNRLMVRSRDSEAVRWTIEGRNQGNVLRGEGSPVEFENIAHLIGSAGEDTFVFGGDEGSIRTIDGGAGSARIHGKDINTNWIIDGANSFGVSGGVGNYLDNFVNVNHLQGGSGNDVFKITSDLSGWAVASIDGGDGENTLTGAPVASTWKITSAKAGSVHHAADDSSYLGNFTNIQKIIAGNDGDTLIDVSEIDSWNIREWIISEAGKGTLTAVSADRESSTQLIEFEGISSIQGNAAKDELRGPDLDITWIIDGPDGGRLESTEDSRTLLSFTDIENLIGGAGEDIFKVQEDGSLSGFIDGGTGNDVLVGKNKNNTWTITGQGEGQLQYSESAAAYIETFFNIENLVGNESEDAFIFDEKGSIQTVDGGSGSAKIQGKDINTAWIIDAASSFGVSGGIGDYLGRFVNINHLQGGSGNDDFTITSDLSGWAVASIDGGDGENTLTGAPIASTWKITSGSAGSVHHAADDSPYLGNFSNIQKIIAGNDGDTLIDVSELDSWNIREWIISEAGKGTLTAVSADRESSAQLIEFEGISGIQGNAAKDELRGPDADITWVIDGPDGGRLESTTASHILLSFTGIESLIGGAGEDLFKIQQHGSVSGLIDGGKGRSQLDVTALSATSSYSIEIGGSSAANLRVINIDEIRAGGEAKLILADGDNEWLIDGPNSGKVIKVVDGEISEAVSFSGVADLVGGSDKDDFVFSSNNAALTGTIDGGDGSNSITGRPSKTKWVLTGVNQGTLSDGGSAYLKSFENIQDILAGGQEDTLISDLELGTFWNISGEGSGSISVAGGTGPLTYIAFHRMHNLHGGNTSNHFIFIDDGSVRGEVRGGWGEDRIVGKNEFNTWTISSAGSGELEGLISGTYVSEFHEIDVLEGGAEADHFHFIQASSSIMKVDGQGGNNVIYGAPIATRWLLKAAHSGQLTSANTLYLDTFENIQTLVGGSDSDTLVGLNVDSQWLVDAQDSGRIIAGLSEDSVPKTVIDFQNMNSLQGGSGADIFRLVESGRFSGLIDGGEGIDHLQLELHNNFTWTLNGEGSGSVADSGGKPYVGGFSALENLQGGSGNDEFIFATDTASIRGIVDGGGGANRLTGRPSDTEWLLGFDSDLMNSGRIRSGGLGGATYATFVNIHHLQGAEAYWNELFGARQANYWDITGSGSGMVRSSGDARQIGFSGMSSLFGNAEKDEFTFLGGHITGTIDGGAGDDIFRLSSDSVGTRVEGGDGDDELYLTIAAGAQASLAVDNVEQITLDGGDGSIFADHRFEALKGSGTLSYISGDMGYALDYTGANGIKDGVVADTLTIRSRLLADEVLVKGDNTYMLVGHDTDIAFDQKVNLVFSTAQQDTITMGASLNLDGAVTFKNATVNYQSGTLNAQELHFDRTAGVGLSNAPLRTNVNDVFFGATQGAVYLADRGGDLNIAQANIGGTLSIRTAGSLTSSVPLTSKHDLSAVADYDIHLTHSNSLSGKLSLDAGRSISLKNLEATHLYQLYAKSLDIDSRGSIHGSGPLEIEGLAVLSSDGDVLLENSANSFQDVRIDKAHRVAIRSDRGDYKVTGVKASGPLDIYSGRSLSLSGSIETTDSINIEAVQDVAQPGNLQGESIRLTSGGNIVMSSGGSTRAISGINYQGSDIGIGQLSAAWVDLNSSGSIYSNHSSDVNIVADQLYLNAETGIGGRDAVSTLVDELFLVNNVGQSYLVNGKELYITGLYSNGDIRLRNTLGNVYLAPQPGETYRRYHNDARFAGGLVDANYEIGTLTLDLDNGSLFTTAAPDSNYPILAARNMWLTTPRGGMGQPVYPLMVYVKDNLILVSAQPSWIRYAFESRPVNIDDSGTISGDIADLIGAGTEQLVEIEQLSDIDPAVFTNVRNYTYDDIAIRLPDDQRYDAEEDD